jgi:hypothetical protein
MAKEPGEEACAPRTPRGWIRRQMVRPDGTTQMVRYSKGLTERICERIAAGESWSSFHWTEGMPSYSTLYTWRDKHPEFAAALQRARDMAADWWAEQALEVAREATKDTATADRLHVNTLLWHAARGAPYRYGSRERKESAKPEVVRVLVSIRDWVPVRLPDGRLVAKEVNEDGSFVDGE